MSIRPSRVRTFASGVYWEARRLLSYRRMDCPDWDILVGTHHKSGTVWMKRIFATVAADFGLKFYIGSQAECPPDAKIFMEPHSRFDFDVLERDYRGLHMVRDPRDMIVSACFYHLTSTEPWLHVPRPELR